VKKLILIITLIPILLFSAEIQKTVMVKIISESKIKKIDIEMLNSSLEMNLTKLNYGIISQDIQEEALKEQQNQRKSDCYDDGCLVDTGRMLAARELLVLNIKKRAKDFFIKARRIDIETGVVEKSDITIIKKDYDENVAHKKISEMINILFNDDYTPNNSTKENNLLIKEDDIIDLQIETNPSDAIIILNEKKMGGSPFNERILKGKLKLEIRKEFYQIIKKTIDTSKKTNFNFDLELKPEYTYLNIKIDQDNTIIKLNEEIINGSVINKIVKKGIYKLKIEKEYYETIEEEIDTRVKTDFQYSLKPIEYTKEIVSSGENIELYDENGTKYTTPFKIKITVGDNKKFILKKDGFKNEHLFIYVYSKEKEIFPVKKLKIHKLRVNNKIGLDSLIKGEGKNGKINIKLSKGINKFKLYEGDYDIKGEKEYYKDYDKRIYVEENGIYHFVKSKACCESDIKTNLKGSLELKLEKDYYYNFIGSIGLISEYTYSDLSNRSVNIGIGFKTISQRDNGSDLLFLSLGALGDFYNKSFTFKISVMNLMFYAKQIFVQFGFYGFGDEVDFLYKDEKLYVNGLISFRTGGDIYFSYPSVKMTIYLRMASLTDTSIKRDEYKMDDVIFSIGTSFSFGQKASKY
jgi:hypothetical protein